MVAPSYSVYKMSNYDKLIHRMIAAARIVGQGQRSQSGILDLLKQATTQEFTDPIYSHASPINCQYPALPE